MFFAEFNFSIIVKFQPFSPLHFFAMMNKFGIFLVAFLCVNITPNLAASVESVEGNSKEETTATNEISKPAAEAVPVQETNSLEQRTRLISKLFTNYDKRNYPHGSTLNFGVSVTKINVDEDNQVLQVDGWLKMTWNDSRLMWDPSEFGGETVFRYPSTEIWNPDISLYNTADSEHSLRCLPVNVLIYSSGEVLWVPPCRMDGLCSNMTLDTTPYEKQTCNLKFGSWTFDGSIMDLQSYKKEEKIQVEHITKNQNWDLLESPVKRVVNYYSCCKEPYVTIDLEFNFQRKANSHSTCH